MHAHDQAKVNLFRRLLWDDNLLIEGDVNSLLASSCKSTFCCWQFEELLNALGSTAQLSGPCLTANLTPEAKD